MSVATELEIRRLSKVEVRDVEGDSRSVSISGYAVVYGKGSQDLGGFVEIIAAGAFTENLAANPDVRMLIEHGHADALPLARTTSGTLKLTEDATGIRFETSLDLTDPDVQRVVPKLRRGDVTGMSFGFWTDDNTWAEVDGVIVRTVTKARISEISIVGDPAYLDSSVALRSMKKAMARKENFDVLRARLDLLSLRAKQSPSKPYLKRTHLSRR